MLRRIDDYSSECQRASSARTLGESLAAIIARARLPDRRRSSAPQVRKKALLAIPIEFATTLTEKLLYTVVAIGGSGLRADRLAFKLPGWKRMVFMAGDSS